MKAKQRLLSPILLAFMGTMILANIAAQMILPLQSLYVQDLGASIKQVGVFFTIGAIAPIFFQIFGGWLSDLIGRLQAIAIGSIAGASAYIFYIFAPSWYWLLPSTMLTSMAVAFVSPSFQAFIAEESTEESTEKKPYKLPKLWLWERFADRKSAKLFVKTKNEILASIGRKAENVPKPNL